MKTSSDPRHIKRAHLVQDLFAWQFNPTSKTSRDLELIIKNVKTIDQEIEKAAPSRPLDQVNKIDLAILRLAIFELIIEKGQPFKVVVDEAIELAKKFGTDSSSAFVNGVLGKVIENNNI